MKSTLEFDLPEEKDELKDALNGSVYKARIDTLYDEVFRPHMKYNKPILAKDESSMQELTDEQLEIIEQIWENVFKHFEDVLE
jgi:hypothetical protein